MADTPTPSDPVAAIREALALGPTPGTWRALSARNSMPAVFAGPITIAHVFNPPVGNAEANAALIAACNPAAIAALLAQLEAAQRFRADWEADQTRLEWLSHHWGGRRPDYAAHVLHRGGDGDISDIRTFVDAALAEQQEGKPCAR